MTLRGWLENRWLVEHETSVEEVADLLSLVERDLEDAAVDRLSPDWRMSIAYNVVGLRASVMNWLRERHPKLVRSL